MNEEPREIWAVTGYIGPHDMRGEWATDPAKILGPAKRFVPADLLPRWRPIKELREEWKDGRVIVLRFADGDVSTFDGIDAREWRNYLRVNKPLLLEFLDFGGHSMPAYDGGENE